jgi:Dolichyl-phosphate-mannose-protein mannosyltransferase
MEGHPTGKTAPEMGEPANRAASPPRGSSRRDLALIGLLLLTALALRAWHFRHTEVAARDSIGFIRYAWLLGHHPWVDTIRDVRQEQHFGYPMAILAVSYPVRQFVTGPETTVMQLSAQLTSCLASVLLVVPTFYLGRELFNRGVGFWAALLFQCLPAGGRVFADGLSEGVFLLFAATALFGSVRAFRAHTPAWFALAGVAGALAYLTRPEGALIVAAAGVVLIAVQCVRAQRAPWLRFVACGIALSVSAVTVGSPLFLITGKLTVKPTAGRVFDHIAGAGEPAAAAGAEVHASLPFAVWLPETDPAFVAVGREFVKGGHYVLWLPTMLGLWWFRARFRLLPGAWVMLLVSLTILTLMWRVAALLGYVSDRHLLLPLLCGIFPAVAMIPQLMTLAAALIRWLPDPGGLRASLPAASHPVWTALFLAGLALAALPKTLEPLHANRSGFKDAGTWIAGHSHKWDEVVDPYSWSNYYAGRVFLESEPPAAPAGEKKVAYLVIEESGHVHDRLKMEQTAKDWSKAGRKVWQWKGRRRKEIVEVVVYEVPK